MNISRLRVKKVRRKGIKPARVRGPIVITGKNLRVL
jgi:hypothetical protein